MNKNDIKPFISWSHKNTKINTEHGVVKYEEFCKNEVKRMKNDKRVIYDGDRVCVA